ncbi:MAG: histidinol-phosphate transaminase [Peptococcia bacterium]
MYPRIRKSLEVYQRETYTDHSSLELNNARSYLDCSLGVNPYGCSPNILHSPPPPQELFTSYPAASPNFIRQIINYWQDIVQLEPGNIQLEAGSFGVIERLHKLFLDEDSYVLGYCPQFSDYQQDVLLHGAKYDYICLEAEDNYKFNAAKLRAALNDKYKLLYLDNPNNPTGQVIPLTEIESLVSRAQDLGIAVLVDEAYGDYMAKDNSAIALVPHYKNLYVAKSFTKGFGLAGLRVGYVVMSEELLETYALVAHPFPVNALGQYYASLALQNVFFLQECRRKNSIAKERIRQACSKLQILYTDPYTPILTLLHPQAETDLEALFLKHNVLTTSGRHFKGLGSAAVRLRLPGDELDRLLNVIREIENN